MHGFSACRLKKKNAAKLLNLQRLAHLPINRPAMQPVTEASHIMRPGKKPSQLELFHKKQTLGKNASYRRIKTIRGFFILTYQYTKVKQYQQEIFEMKAE